MESETLILSPLVDSPMMPPGEENHRSLEHRDLLLPTLWRPVLPATTEAVRVWAGTLLGDAAFASVDYGNTIEVLARLTGVSEEALADNGWQVSNILDRAGFNIAPDAHLERKRLRPGRDSAILYRGVEGPTPCVRLRPYRKGLLLVKFATLMMGAMSEDELEAVDRLLGMWTTRADYRLHLRAMLRWYNSRRRMLDAVTRRTASEVLTVEDRQKMAAQLLQTASMRGAALSAPSVYQLDRLLQLLGHAPGEVHSMLHRAAMGIAPSTSASPSAGSLDSCHLRIVEQETARAQKLLAEVFDEPEHTATTSETQASSLTAFVAALLTREQWPLTDMEALPRPSGMSLEAALEAVNDMAAERVGDTVVDLDGQIAYVTLDYKNDLLE